MELICTIIFSFVIISALFIASIWVVEIWYSVQYMRESLNHAEREINALTVRIHKHDIYISRKLAGISSPHNFSSNMAVRMEEMEKRMTIVSQSNFAKIEKLDGKINSLLTRFELFDQSARLSRSLFADKSTFETLSKKIDTTIKHFDAMYAEFRAMRDANEYEDTAVDLNTRFYQ